MNGRGNGLLGAQHKEMPALFRTMDPRLKRIIMSHAAELLVDTADISDAVQVLILQAQNYPPRLL
jgi:hypothetical protein